MTEHLQDMKDGWYDDNMVIWNEVVSDIVSSTAVKTGVKYDSQKPRTDLLPPRTLLEVAKVLSFGAKKYDPNNWKNVEDLQARYTAAALRHIMDHMVDPDAVDNESGIDTLAHAICCLMFKLEDKLEKASKSQGTREANAPEH